MYQIFIGLLLLTCDGHAESADKTPLINAQIYSSMFVRRREELKTLLDHFQRTEKYDRKFKLLEIGINQILTILRENKRKMILEKYSLSVDGWPKTTTMIDALTLILENTCLIGDMILHMPDMSENILSKDKEWIDILNWAVEFTSSVQDVIDAKTTKMLSLADQEINIENRTGDYINPYREKPQANVESKKLSKEKKKLKKGPRLHSAGRTEL